MAQAKRGLLPIGVHLTQDAVWMAQLEQDGDDVRVVSKATCSLTSDADTLARVVSVDHGPAGDAGTDIAEHAYAKGRMFVAQKIASDGFCGKDGAISLPQDQLVIKHLRLPPMNPEELNAALPYELQGKLPFNPQEAIVRHIVAGSVSENSETKQDVLVLATPKHVVEKHVAAMSRLGLTVTGVGVEPCAMCYAYAFAASRAQPSQAGPACVMIVYLGAQTTYVAILRGQETTFVKGVGHGTDRWVEAVAKVKGISLEEAVELTSLWRTTPSPATFEDAVDTYNRVRTSLEHLVDEIESCIRYHASLARGAGVDHVHFVGPGARDRALVRVVSARLAIPCDVGDPFGVVTGTPDPETAEPEMAVAVGLSLFGAR
ncbi:MAG TPA: pilus assembly protein PilM [Phycisphaerae bacterium]|nr:pilus assembly protein PilM [Phycisphaerae bacterium]